MSRKPVQARFLRRGSVYPCYTGRRSAEMEVPAESDKRGQNKEREVAGSDHFSSKSVRDRRTPGPPVCPRSFAGPSHAWCHFSFITLAGIFITVFWLREQRANSHCPRHTQLKGKRRPEPDPSGAFPDAPRSRCVVSGEGRQHHLLEGATQFNQ